MLVSDFLGGNSMMAQDSGIDHAHTVQYCGVRSYGRDGGLRRRREWRKLEAGICSLGIEICRRCAESSPGQGARGGPARSAGLPPSAGSGCDPSPLRRAGRIDVLINNAGISRMGPLLEQPLSELREVLDTNVIGQLCISQVPPAPASATHPQGSGLARHRHS